MRFEINCMFLNFGEMEDSPSNEMSMEPESPLTKADLEVLHASLSEAPVKIVAHKTLRSSAYKDKFICVGHIKIIHKILKQHLQRYSFIGCELCTHQCECVGTNKSSFTEEQVSRNLPITDRVQC